MIGDPAIAHHPCVGEGARALEQPGPAHVLLLTVAMRQPTHLDRIGEERRAATSRYVIGDIKFATHR